MSSNWETVKLGDYCSKIGSGSTPRGGSNIYLDIGQFALIRSQNILNNSFSINGLVYIDENEANKLKNVSVEENDVLLNITGDSVARVCKAPKEYLPARVNQHVAIIRTDEINLDSSYLNYYLNSLDMQNYMLSLASTGATRNALTKNMIENFQIIKPPLPIQKKIAHILSTLDDKIELNRKMNQTLEAMASAIFKSWFVDFDPVHAKANCKDETKLENIVKELGISKEILDLFPNEFEESELGIIPKEWKRKSFGDVVVPKRGKTITKRTITEGIIPVVAGGLSPAYYHGEYNAEAPVITISASGANAGYVNLYNENIWASDCSYLNNTNTKYVYSMYLFLKAQQYEITRMQQGAAQPHVYPKDLIRLMIVDCGEKFWELLEKMITPIFEKIANNQNEIQTLEKTRDTLLPKLLSGEIEV
jgi:type I restriction enzyme, S subunit